VSYTSDKIARIVAAVALIGALYATYAARQPQPQFQPDVAAFVNKAYENSTVASKVRQALLDAEKKQKDAEAEAARLREELAKAKEK
jgi:hypothetical protein